MNLEIHVTARYQLWGFVVETGWVDTWRYALTSIALVSITFDTLDNEASFQRAINYVTRCPVMFKHLLDVRYL